jgi:hypothetical protein
LGSHQAMLKTLLVLATLVLFACGEERPGAAAKR